MTQKKLTLTEITLLIDCAPDDQLKQVDGGIQANIHLNPFTPTEVTIAYGNNPRSQFNPVFYASVQTQPEGFPKPIMIAYIEQISDSDKTFTNHITRFKERYESYCREQKNSLAKREEAKIPALLRLARSYILESIENDYTVPTNKGEKS